MYTCLVNELVGFKNISLDVRNGLTHTEIRIVGDSVKIRKPGFVCDIYINRRTQEVSVARIDSKDEPTLRRILRVVSGFKF
jgi:hypothetical protein